MIKNISFSLLDEVQHLKMPSQDIYLHKLNNSNSKKETSFILLPLHTEEPYKSSQCAPISTAQTKKYYCNIASKAYSCILFSLVTLIFPASYLAPADRHLTAELQVCSKQAEPTAISLNSSLKDVILCFSLLATYSITVFILKRAKVDYWTF